MFCYRSEREVLAVSIALVSDYRGDDECAEDVDCEGDEGWDEDDLGLLSRVQSI